MSSKASIINNTEAQSIATEWRPVRLGDLIKIKHGFPFEGKYFSDSPTNYILLTPGNFSIGGGFSSSKFKYYNGNVSNDYVLKERDLVVTMTDLSKAGDTLGYSALIPKIDGKSVLHNQRIGLVVFKSKDIIPDYLYWKMRNYDYRSWILGSATGTTVKHTSPLRIEDFEFLLPNTKEQERIAEILSSLDDKIELNRQINANLEKLASALFKHWFVDFEFPDNNGKPYKSSGGKMVDSELGEIPVGWKAGKLGEEFEIIMGQSPSGETYNENEEGLPFYQGRTDFGFRFPSRRIYCTEPKRKAKSLDTLISVRAPVGDINMAYEECCIGRGVGAIRKDSFPSYTYHTVKSLQKLISRYDDEGTVFGSINKESLANIACLIPPETVIIEFEKNAGDIDKQIFNLTEENERLIKIRDSLLPRLMSGKIRV